VVLLFMILRPFSSLLFPYATLFRSFWFSLAHILAFIAATTVVAFPMAFAGILPIGVVLGGVLLVALLYFAVADFLYLGRLAGYRSEEHTSELQSREKLVCRLLLEKK